METRDKKLSDFFVRKTAEVRDTIDVDNSSVSETVVMDAGVAFEGQYLTKLKPTTQDKVSNIMMSLPTYLLKQILEYILPLIIAITNGSVVESIVAN